MVIYVYTNEFRDNIMYVTSSEKIQSYTGNKKSFMGKGGVTNPDGLNKITNKDIIINRT